MKNFLLFSVFSMFLFSSTWAQFVVNEDFSGLTFPPSGWSRGPNINSDNSDPVFTRANASAYAIGTGDAICTFYSYQTGEDSLVTPDFSPTGTDDTLYFDHAYRSYTSEVDELHVEYSTNGGATYTELIYLPGGAVVGTGMVTAAPSSTNYLSPTAVQWASKKYALLPGVVKIKFRIVTAYGNNLHLDNIKVGKETALPLELSSFTALTKGNNIVLNWETKTETNSFKFEIEKNSQSGWIKIGEVNASGNSNSTKKYSFTDKSTGKVSYRLKMIDNDGTWKYSSQIESDEITAPLIFNLAQNYPNPFNPETTFDFTVSENVPAVLKIYNALGEEAATLFNSYAESGKFNKVKFNASGLASGVYFARLQSGGQMMMKKLVYMK